MDAYSSSKNSLPRPSKAPLIRADPERRADPVARAHPSRADPTAAEQQAAMPSSSKLLLCDFDKTVADFDAGKQTGSCPSPCWCSEMWPCRPVCSHNAAASCSRWRLTDAGYRQDDPSSETF